MGYVLHGSNVIDEIDGALFQDRERLEKVEFLLWWIIRGGFEQGETGHVTGALDEIENKNVLVQNAIVERAME